MYSVVSRKKENIFLCHYCSGAAGVVPGCRQHRQPEGDALELFKGLFIEYNENVATIYDLRFPRILIAIFGGAATAVSGVLLQAVMKTRWPTRASSASAWGKSDGGAHYRLCADTVLFTPLFAFLGGMIAFLLVYSLSWKGGLSPLRIILVGVAVNAMFTGLMSAFNPVQGVIIQASPALSTPTSP